MLKSIIRTLLQKFIDDIDSDNCNITMEQQSKIISVLSNIANPDQRMSKIQACDYLGVSRATFDNYVRDGFIPKGIKQEGFKELSWQKSDLDITAEINGTSASFQKLPAMGDIADFGNNIVVSCNKEAMNSEVSSMKQRSLDIINSIETHQSIIKGCDEILSQLNPEIVEKQRQEQENKALREEINSLKEMFREFIKTSLKQEQHGNNN